MKNWRKQFIYWWWRNFSRKVISISFEEDPYGPGDIIVDGTGKKYLHLGKNKMRLIKKKLTRSEFIAEQIKLPDNK